MTVSSEACYLSDFSCAYIQCLLRSIQIMVSRKKNKGKERKAKKEEIKKAERRRRWERLVRGEDENNRKVIHCDHGCTVEVPDVLDHPVANFMDDFFATGDWMRVLNSHAKLWSNDTYRNMTTDILLNIGANLLLGNDSQIQGDSIDNIEHGQARLQVPLWFWRIAMK